MRASDIKRDLECCKHRGISQGCGKCSRQDIKTGDCWCSLFDDAIRLINYYENIIKDNKAYIEKYCNSENSNGKGANSVETV